MPEAHRILCSLLLLAGVITGCSDAEAPRSPEAAISVPGSATRVTTVDRDDARFELFADGGCAYLTVTNLVDGVTRNDEVCGRHTFTNSDGCLQERTSGDGSGENGSEDAPPCDSEVPWEALWGRHDYDFVGIACVRDLATPVSADGEWLLLTPNETGLREPAFLLADGRPVQGPAWGAALDDAALRRCRRAAGIVTEPVGPPAHVPFRLAGLDAPAGSTVEVSTNTGYLALYDSRAAPTSPQSTADQLVVFPDTQHVAVRSFGGLDEAARKSWTVPVTDDIRSAVARTGCAIEVDLDTEGTGQIRTVC